MLFLEDKTRQRLRIAATGIGFPLAFVVWLASGFDRGGAVTAAWISLVAIGISALLRFGHSLFVGLEGSLRFPAIITLGGLASIPVCTLVWANYHGWAWLWTLAWLSTGLSAYKAAWEELDYFSQKGDPSVLAASILDDKIGTKRLHRKMQWIWVVLWLLYLTLAQVASLPKPVMVALFILAWATGVFDGVLSARIYRAESRRRHPIF